MITLFLLGSSDYAFIGTVDFVYEPYTCYGFYITDSILRKLVINNHLKVIGMHCKRHDGRILATKDWDLSKLKRQGYPGYIAIHHLEDDFIRVVDADGNVNEVCEQDTCKNILNKTENGLYGLMDYRFNSENQKRCLTNYETIYLKSSMLGCMADMRFSFPGNEVILCNCIIEGNNGVVIPNFVTVLGTYTIICDTSLARLNNGLKIIAHRAFVHGIKNEIYIPSTVELICPEAFLPAKTYEKTEIKRENDRIDCLVDNHFRIKNIGHSMMFIMNKYYDRPYVIGAIVNGKEYF